MAYRIPAILRSAPALPTPQWQWVGGRPCPERGLPTVRPGLLAHVPITAAAVSPLDRALWQSFHIASDRASNTDAIHSVVVTLHSARPAHPLLIGYGEGAPLFGISGDTQDSLLADIRAVLPDLQGRALNVFELEAILSRRGMRFPAARAAIEMAFFDLVANANNLPLALLLNPRPVRGQNLESDVTIPIVDEPTAESLPARFSTLRFRRFKIKVGDGVEQALTRIRAVHRTCPDPERQYLLDANEGFSAAQAIQLVDTLSRCGIGVTIFEQPVPRHDLAGLKEVRTALQPSGVLVFADESVFSLADAWRIIAEDAADGINLKVMKHGGILATLRIAELATQFGLKLMIGGMIETDLAMHTSVEIAYALGNVCWFDLDTPLFLVPHPEDLLPQVAYDGHFLRACGSTSSLIMAWLEKGALVLVPDGQV